MNAMPLTTGQSPVPPDWVPVADPRAENMALQAELQAAMHRVLSRGTYILGDETAAFESEWAQYLGLSHCVGVASGTDAIVLALRAVGVGPGHEVITVSQTAVATVAAIELIGAVPVCVDIDPQTRCMDPQRIAAAVTRQTRAILPVHLYGQPADMEAILNVASGYGIPVVEDCAQAHGAAIADRKVGTFGQAAAFSFYPTKNLGAMGDGGAVVTQDADIARRVRELREYGWRERYVSHSAGMNSRLDEIQAAILRVKLPLLERRNERRRVSADRYRQAIESETMRPPRVIPGTTHAMHLCVVECADRDAVVAMCAEHAIRSAQHYPVPVHLQPAYRGRIKGGAHLPVTEALTKTIVTLPCYPDQREDHVTRVCALLRAWTGRGGSRASAVDRAA